MRAIREEFVQRTAVRSSIGIRLKRLIAPAGRKEENLNDAARRFRLATEAAGVGVFEYDLTNHTPYWSDTAKALFGVGPADPFDFDVFVDHLHPDDRDAVIASCEAAIDPAQKKPLNLRHRVVDADGGVRWIHARGKVLFEPDGERERPTRFVGTLVDVTDTKRTEDALVESEASFHGLFDAVNEAIYLQDRDGRFVDVNEGAVRMYGYSKSELIGNRHEMLSAPGRNDPDEARRRIAAALDGSPQRFECWGRRKNGHVFPKDVSLVPGRYFGRDVLIGVARDITQQKVHEQTLIEARTRAEELAYLKETFLTNMSHEIRTPLTGIIGISEIMAEEPDEDHRELVPLIAESGRRLLATLESLMEFAQLESERVDVELDTVCPIETVRDVLPMFRKRCQEKDIALVEDFCSEEFAVRGNRGCIARALTCLLDNAVKFTAFGRVTVSVRRTERYGEISVADTGVGIAEDALGRIFDEFAQESTGHARDFEGVGLGLTITERLVRLSGGEIGVESTKGFGSTFSLRLPLDETESAGPESSISAVLLASSRLPAFATSELTGGW